VVLTHIKLWQLYNKFPTPTSKSAGDQTRLRREIVRLKRELNTVSAQDEFSKWAKLRRQHDKAVADYDKLSMCNIDMPLLPTPCEVRLTDCQGSSLQSSKSSFDTQLTTFRLIGINGLRLFLQYMYNRRPLFWIPKGWLPYYAEWLLSFPMAPLGSISIYMWSIACANVIQILTDVLVAGFVLGAGDKRQGGQVKGTVGGEKKAK
jgi:tail-anchored protein insertion receptor